MYERTYCVKNLDSPYECTVKYSLMVAVTVFHTPYPTNFPIAEL